MPNSNQSLEELHGLLEDLEEEEHDILDEIKEEPDLIAEFFTDAIHEKNVDNLQEGLEMFADYNITGTNINALHIIIPDIAGVNTKPRTILAFAKNKGNAVIVGLLRDFGLKDKSPTKTRKKY